MADAFSIPSITKHILWDLYIPFLFFFIIRSINKNKKYKSKYKAIQGNTRQFKAIQGNTRQFKAIQGSSRQFKAIQGSSRQYKAIQGNTRQYKAIGVIYYLL